MSRRELAYRFGLVGLILVGVLLAAIVAGKADGIAWPLFGLAQWLSLLLVVRPLVYESYGRKTGDWITIILILGPLFVFVAPFLWWEHRHLEPGT